jgi:Flp pilus assembly protein TadB
MTLIRNLVIAFAVAAFAWSVLGWMFTRRDLKSMTQIEKANAEIDAATRREKRRTPKKMLQDALAQHGYKGDLTPIMVGITFVYLILTVVMISIGFNSLIGAVLAVPFSAGLAVLVSKHMVSRRKRKFQEQLLQALTLLAAQVEAGNGPQLALDRIIPSLQDPIRSELTATMDATVASKNLVQAMKDLEARYPSRPFQMFISALEIDEAKGGRLEPALRQAAAALQRDFDLGKEATAEIAQQKLEFIAITGIIGGIVVMVVVGNKEAAAESFLSPMGLVISAVTLANVALGIYRALNIFRKAQGE